MLKLILASFLLFLAKPSFADAREDVEFFMTHFMSDGVWGSIRNIGRFNVAANEYADELQIYDVDVIDTARFRDMIIPHIRQELIDQQEAHVADAILEYFGADDLSDIVYFFRNETGEKMLVVAATEGISMYGHRRRQWSEEMVGWSDYLSLQDLTYYSNFISTSAGAKFIHSRDELLQFAFRAFLRSPARFKFEPNLNQPFILEILETDGVVEFSNSLGHQTLRREIGGGLDQ